MADEQGEALASSSPAPQAYPAYQSGRLLFCQVCRQQLTGGERKVHHGVCARARKTELQAQRRRNARHRGGVHGA